MESHQPIGFFVSAFGKSSTFMIWEEYDIKSLHIPRISDTMIEYHLHYKTCAQIEVQMLKCH